MNMCDAITPVELSRIQHAEIVCLVKELTATARDTHDILAGMKEVSNAALHGVAKGLCLLAYVIMAIPVFLASTWALHSGSIDQWSWTFVGIILVLPVLGKDVKSILPMVGKFVK